MKLYAEGEGKLDEGQPFPGYAARFINPKELEPLIKDVNQNSLDVVFDTSQLFNAEFNEVDAIFLFLSLLALPTLVAPLSCIAFIFQNKAQKKTNESNEDLLPFVLGFITTCILGSIVMLLFQMAGFNKDDPWFYIIPYSWLWTLVVIQFIASLLLTHNSMSTRSNPKKKKHHFWRPLFWLQCISLWIVFTTALMLSWHLVFIMLGFILNPFRALILTLIFTTGIICNVLLLSIIFSFCQLIYQCFKAKKYHVYFALVYFIVMIAIVIFIISYISFMFRINIGDESIVGTGSLTDWINHILPPLFLLILIWLLQKLLKLPSKFNKTDDEDKNDDIVSPLQFDEKLYNKS